MAFLEFDQDINIALRRKVVPENRTEERQFSNMVTTAEIGQLLVRDREFQTVHGASIITFLRLGGPGKSRAFLKHN